MGGSYPRPGRQLQLPIDQIRQWASEGRTLEEMAADLGCSKNGVWKAMKRHGIPRLPASARPEHHWNWKGGRCIDVDGYILVRAPDHPHCDNRGYIREHRLVMERVLGRYLLPTEVVDHIDGQRANNDPSNLRVFASNREHLAATLKERVPDWSPEGKERLRAAARQREQRKRTSSQTVSGSDGAP